MAYCRYIYEYITFFLSSNEYNSDFRQLARWLITKSPLFLLTVALFLIPLPLSFLPLPDAFAHPYVFPFGLQALS